MIGFSMTVWGYVSGQKFSTCTIPCERYTTVTRTDSNPSKLYVCRDNDTDYPTRIAEIPNNGTYDISSLDEVVLSVDITNGSWDYRNTVTFEFS